MEKSSSHRSSSSEIDLEPEETSAAWIGYDLDGTLARYDGWHGWDHIGEPIPEMVERIKRDHANGKRVKIFTARIAPTSTDPTKPGGGSPQEVRSAIEDWCRRNLGFVPEITHEKDYNLVDFYDDRVHQVVPNTGKTLSEYLFEYINGKNDGSSLFGKE